jgi:enoyl-CoA hydratase/carnithine racemase
MITAEEAERIGLVNKVVSLTSEEESRFATLFLYKTFTIRMLIISRNVW